MPPKAKPTTDSSTATIGDIWFYGQDNRSEAKADKVKWAQCQQPKQNNATTHRLAVMIVALRGIEADFGPEQADTFRRDLEIAPLPSAPFSHENS